MKKLFLFICCISFLSVCFAQRQISPDAEKLIDEIFTLRMNLSLCDTSEKPDSALAEIESFKKSHAQRINACTEQEKLIFENFLIMERYNYLYPIQSEKKGLKAEFDLQKKKLDEYFNAHSDDEINKWLYCTRGDVISCSMAFSLNDMMKGGMAVKPLYEKSIELDSGFAYAIMNLGQWYYWAPGIAGGSKKKALELCKKSVEFSKTPAEKYYACIFTSQILYEMKDYENAERYLSDAESCCPKSNYIKTIRKANNNKMSLFEYNRKRSKLD